MELGKRDKMIYKYVTWTAETTWWLWRKMRFGIINEGKEAKDDENFVVGCWGLRSSIAKWPKNDFLRETWGVFQSGLIKYSLHKLAWRSKLLVLNCLKYKLLSFSNFPDQMNRWKVSTLQPRLFIIISSRNKHFQELENSGFFKYHKRHFFSPLLSKYS